MLYFTDRYSLLEAVPLESQLSEEIHLPECEGLPLSTSTSAALDAVLCDGDDLFGSLGSPHCQSLSSMRAREIILPIAVHSDLTRTPVQAKRIYGKEVVIPLPLLTISRVYGNEPSCTVDPGGWKKER